MTLRRYAVILPVLIALLAAAIFIAASGQEGARAADKTSAKTEQISPKTGSSSDSDSTKSDSTKSDSSSDETWGDSSSDTWGSDDDSDDTLGSGDDSDDTWGDDDSEDSEDGIGEGGSAEGDGVLGVGDTENVAVDNRLKSAKVIKQDTDDDEEEWVRFCFGDDIQSLDENKASSFAVIGPDSQLGETATEVELDDARDNCVLVAFDSDSDVRSYTLAAVEGGVVENRDDEKNIADSVKLDGGHSKSARNRTSGPDLTGVNVSTNLNRVKYYFDEDLEDDSADAGSFGFYTERGNARVGSEIVSVDDRTVTVEFSDDDQVENARRGFVQTGAVQDTGGSDNPVGSLGRRTSNPDLTDVSKSGADTEYDFRFDDNISGDVDASDFVLITDNNETIEGEDADVDGKKVHVSFEREIEDYDTDSIVLAAVNPDADVSDSGVDSSDDDSSSSDEEITLGVKKLGSSSTRSGRTTGPDLVNISTDANGRRMTLTFDEKVNDEDDDYDASGIYIATDDDSLVASDRILEIEGKKVYVKADENLLDSLLGVTLESGAIEDPEGNGNPLGTVAHGSASELSTTNSLYGHSYGNTDTD